MKKIDNSTATETNLFTDGDPAVPTPATTLPAWYMNMLQVELVKLVEMAGITLDTAEEGDVLNNQIAQALAVHVAGLDFYNDTGAADAYVLSPIGADEAENTVPPAYFEGQRVRFLPDNDSTGACTVRVGALSIKNIKEGAGAGTNPPAGRIVTGVMTELFYDSANDCFKFSQSQGATPAFESALFHARDEKASGTGGGTSTTGDNTRVLNTVLTNEITGASLSSNQITLPAGDYIVLGRAPGYDADTSKVFLYNVTDSANILVGSSSYNSQSLCQVDSFLQGKFTIDDTKVIEFRQWFQHGAANELGFVSVSWGGVEVYADIMLWKVG